MKKSWTLLCLFLALNGGFANPPTTLHFELQWEEPFVTDPEDGTRPQSLPTFEGAVYSSEFEGLPVFSHRLPLEGYGRLEVVLANAVYEPFQPKGVLNDALLSERIAIQTAVEQERRQWFGRLRFVPIRKGGSGYERLRSFDLRVVFTPEPPPLQTRGGDTFSSVLNDGQIFKIAVSETGVHKLTYDLLKTQLQVPVDEVDPRTLKLYGNGGGMLPLANSAPRYDDLQENAILVVGEADGRFDPGDYILFFGEGASKWVYDTESGEFRRPMNWQDSRNYYFLKISPGNGLRIASIPQAPGSTYTTTTYDEHLRYEKEEFNLLHEWNLGQGSGQQWYGDYFKLQTSATYDDEFSVEGIVPDAPARLKAAFAGRIITGTGTGWFEISANGNTFKSSNFATTRGETNNLFASERIISGEFIPNSPQFNITLNFVKGSGANNNEGWLNFIQLTFRRELRLYGEQTRFRDLQSMGHAVSTFQVGGVDAGVRVWEVSNPLQPHAIEAALSGSVLSFSAETAGTEPKEFVVFRPEGSLLSPAAVGPIPNQNLHGISDVDMVIVYHPDFQEWADSLARHRTEFSNLSVALVEIGQIYNEFSSGRTSAIAIRDFARLLHQRSERFRYLLLFGDGSYDLRALEGAGNDFIPVFETAQSLDPIDSYPTDDFFGLLSDNEGVNVESGALDIAVGRLPVKTPEEAATAVRKIIRYEKSVRSFGDWRNRLVFVADDGDSEKHTRDANSIADRIGAKNPNLNIDKIYLDAFPQISTPGGTRVPLATEALNQNIFKGVLAVTFMGHGGSKGWTQERVLKISDILGWENPDKLPVFITATCSFAGFDNPEFTTAGEELFLSQKGGSIALLTTVRAVYANENKILTRDVVDTLFSKYTSRKYPIGEVFRAAKNLSNADIRNSRKFHLLGDPAMQLALPRYSVTTTHINGKMVGNGSPDTLRALQRVTVQGFIADENGNPVEQFNGTLFPTIFDKKAVLTTLGQDENRPLSYTLQKNIIFKGRASVKNGRFEFTFVVPKDIDYQFGPGKISYYAADMNMKDDAAGSFEGFIIGGTDSNALADEQGPSVEVFMNTEDFVFGSITSPDPVLLVKLEDDNGINVVGNSIGHDLTAVLDQNTQNTFILNDFYEAALDDHTRGEVRFPLRDLAVGRHEIRVTAWDVANNASQGYTEFLVVEDEKVVLDHVLNYPNPFTTSTCFFFEHNLHGQDLDILVQIYTVSGRLVKSIEQRIFSPGDRLSRDNCIAWDGRDDFGEPLAKGVYLYKVKVRSAGSGETLLEGESDFEKLVILK